MKKIHAVSAVLLASVLAACPIRDPEAPQPAEPADTSRCAAGCARLAVLGCPESAGTEDMTCEEACVYVQQQGLIHLRPSCWEGITECSQVETTCG